MSANVRHLRAAPGLAADGPGIAALLRDLANRIESGELPCTHAIVVVAPGGRPRFYGNPINRAEGAGWLFSAAQDALKGDD